MDARTNQKERLFNELYRFDDTDEEEPDPSPLKAFIHRKTVGQPVLASATKPTRSNQRLERTVSAPTKIASPPFSIHTSISLVEETPIPSPIQAYPSSFGMSAARPGPASKSFPAPSKSKKSTKDGAKRKRGQSFEEVPQSQKVFTGLSLYFFPNNDKDPARRLRIRKTLERGALWVSEWRGDVTHIVVDRTLNYGHLIQYLKVSALPSHVILVNETYPSDCIIYRALINPDQPQYHVDGYKAAQVSSEPATVSSSDKSLVLKPDKGVLGRGPQTPSRAESEQSSLRQHLKEAEARAFEEKQQQIAKQAESKRCHDALDDAIAQIMTLKDLPLDEDDEDGFGNDAAAEDSDANDSKSEHKAKRPKQKKGSADSWQQKFNCMHKHDGLNSSQNPNHRTIQILQEMSEVYERDGNPVEREHNHWRVTAYRKAMAALRKQNTKIMTEGQALAIPYIGSKLALKIEEIAWTDKLRQLENAILDPKDIILQKFLKIYGVGPVQASAWVDQGFHTFDDLTLHAKLSANQKIGITHYEDFLTRIPRPEVELHGKLVREVIRKIDPDIQVTIGGSYRRLADTSGDIDFIVTKPDTPRETLHTLITINIIPLLFSCGYLKTALATTAKETGSKWHGAAAVPSSRIWRRVDFLIVPWDEMGAALIYFTGNDIFNRSIRLLASWKGYRLNQRGLWRDVLRGAGRKRVTQGTLVEGRSERRIFEILGVPYRRPEHRIC